MIKQRDHAHSEPAPACPVLVLFNKPFNVMSQFSPEGDKLTLAHFIDLPNVYPAGRLDFDSEGLLLLTNHGRLQHWLSSPRHKQPKTYLAQVEGVPDEEALTALRQGLLLNDGPTLPADAFRIEPPGLWERNPPIRFRKNVADSWISLTLTEGRNRQVRRMGAAVGHPVLRLVRVSIGGWTLEGLQPGEYRVIKGATLETAVGREGWRYVMSASDRAPGHRSGGPSPRTRRTGGPHASRKARRP
jgi:23S rRNA pseudouridine2457 synthase